MWDEMGWQGTLPKSWLALSEFVTFSGAEETDAAFHRRPSQI